MVIYASLYWEAGGFNVCLVCWSTKGYKAVEPSLHITSSLLLLSAWLMAHSTQELLLLLPLNAASVLLCTQSLSQAWGQISCLSSSFACHKALEASLGQPYSFLERFTCKAIGVCRIWPGSVGLCGYSLTMIIQNIINPDLGAVYMLQVSQGWSTPRFI